MNIVRVGVDIAKSVFHVHGVDRRDQIQWQGKYARNKWLDALSKKVPVGAEIGWRPVRRLTIGLGSCRNGVIMSD